MKKLILLVFLGGLCVPCAKAQEWERLFVDSAHTMIDVQCTRDFIYVLYINETGSSFVKRSANGGGTWTDMRLSGIESPQHLIMLNNKLGYVIGTNTFEGLVTLVKTEDGFENNI